jgi:hypothetical protein
MASSSFFVTHLHVEPEVAISTRQTDLDVFCYLLPGGDFGLDSRNGYFGHWMAPCAVVQALTVVDNSASTWESVLPERFSTWKE